MNFEKITSRKFAVPSAAMLMGLANESLGMGFNVYVVCAIIVASGLYAIGEGIADAGRARSEKHK